MLEVQLCFEDGTVDTLKATLPLDIGRGPDCGLRLKAWRVAKRHARIERRDGGLFLEDFGALSGTLVNGQRVTQYGPLIADDEIVIGPCLIRLCGHMADCQAFPVMENNLPLSVPGTEPLEIADQVRKSTSPAIGQSLAAIDQPATGTPALADAQIDPGLDIILRHRRRLHGALLEALDLRRRDIATMSDDALRSEATAAMREIIAHDTELPASINRKALLTEVVDEAVGLGPLEPLLADHVVTEIMVNRHDEIYIESAGRLVRHSAAFSSEQAVLGVI